MLTSTLTYHKTGRTQMEATHRLVIRDIDKRDRNIPFAIWEVVKSSGCSTSSVTRTLRELEELQLILRNNRGYGNRYYRMAAAWSTADVVIDDFETARVLRVPS